MESSGETSCWVPFLSTLCLNCGLLSIDICKLILTIYTIHTIYIEKRVQCCFWRNYQFNVFMLEPDSVLGLGLKQKSFFFSYMLRKNFNDFSMIWSFESTFLCLYPYHHVRLSSGKIELTHQNAPRLWWGVKDIFAVSHFRFNTPVWSQNPNIMIFPVTTKDLMTMKTHQATPTTCVLM